MADAKKYTTVRGLCNKYNCNYQDIPQASDGKILDIQPVYLECGTKVHLNCRFGRFEESNYRLFYDTKFRLHKTISLEDLYG